MNILRRIAVSLRSSPMAAAEKQSASSEGQGAGFVTLEVLTARMEEAERLWNESRRIKNYFYYERRRTYIEYLQAVNRKEALPKSANKQI